MSSGIEKRGENPWRMPKLVQKFPAELRGMKHRLADAIGEAGFTQKDLERASGVNQSGISLLLNDGRETGGSLANFVRVATALRVRVGWLLSGEEPRRLPGVLPPAKPKVVDADQQLPTHVTVRAKNNK